MHSADRARAAVLEARAAGFDNISLDLMMWLPQQSADDWQANVEALIEAGPDHASLYLLELYPNAPLKEEMARAGWSLAPDDDAAEMYLWSLERLERPGSAVRDLERGAARPRVAPQSEILAGRGVARLRLWRALHPRGVRWKNVSSTEDYIRRVIGRAVPGGGAPEIVSGRAVGGGAVYRACG